MWSVFDSIIHELKAWSGALFSHGRGAENAVRIESVEV